MAASNYADDLGDLPVFDLDTHLDGLAESNLTGRIASVLMAFLKNSENPEVYVEYAEVLIGQIDDLFQAGRHGQVLEIHGLFHTHSSEHPSAAIRAAARGALEHFKDARLIAKIVALYEDGSGLEDHDAVVLLANLGPEAVPHLLDVALEKKGDRITRLLKSFMVKYPERTTAEFAKRLDRGSADGAAGLFALIDRLNDRQSIFRLRPYLKNPNPLIRRQVLGLLLKHRDPYAMPFLGELLDSGSTEEVCAGVDLTGEYAVTEFAPRLYRMIKQHFLLFRSDCLINERIFLALDKMNYPLGADELRALGRRQYAVCADELGRMKNALAQWIAAQHPHPSATRCLRGS